MPGQREQDLGGRQRGVQEEAQARLHAQSTQLAAQRDQMVVVDPDEVVRPDQRRQRSREALD